MWISSVFYSFAETLRSRRLWRGCFISDWQSFTMMKGNKRPVFVYVPSVSYSQQNFNTTYEEKQAAVKKRTHFTFNYPHFKQILPV